MKKHLQTFLVLLSFLVFPNLVFGDDSNQLTNLSITYKPDELNDIYLDWDDSKIEDEIDGYAIQWSDKIYDIRNDKYAKLTSTTSDKLMRLRPGKDQWYYFRVYTYKLDERKKILSNGSKMIKWKRTSGSITEKEELTVTDVDITTIDTSLDETSSISFDFGPIIVMPLDTFADFKWSHQSKMISSDYDGFYITIAKNPDLTDIVKTFKTNRNKFLTRVKGLSPDTQYYVRGAFFKTINGEDSVFGVGVTTKVKAFKTIKAIDRSLNNKVTRNLKKLERKPYFTVEVGIDEKTENNNTVDIEKKQEVILNNNLKLDESVKKRIAEIKAQIRTLESELANLQGKKIVKNTKKEYSSTKEKKSFREIIRERLAARRAAKK